MSSLTLICIIIIIFNEIVTNIFIGILTNFIIDIFSDIFNGFLTYFYIYIFTNIIIVIFTDIFSNTFTNIFTYFIRTKFSEGIMMGLLGSISVVENSIFGIISITLLQRGLSHSLKHLLFDPSYQTLL